MHFFKTLTTLNYFTVLCIIAGVVINGQILKEGRKISGSCECSAFPKAGQ